MTNAWTPKRFWKSASAQSADGGFTVTLDGRAIRTPAKAELIVPTLAMAEAIAAEWDAQEGLVRPETMPVSRAAHSAIDKVGPQFTEVTEMLAEYGGSDLLCYRAENPQELITRQAAAWDPLLAWAAGRYLAPLLVTQGVMHVRQPDSSLTQLRAALQANDPFRIAALHDLIAISGSLILALAVAEGEITAAEAFDLSRIDERWQAEQWGEDEESAEAEAIRRGALLDAARFYTLCG